LRDRRATKQLERTNQVGAQNLDGPPDARLAGGPKPVRVSATHKDSPSAQAKGLDNVTAATDAPVQKHLGLPVHGRDDFRQDAQSGSDAIELTATMIGHHKGVCSLIDGAASVQLFQAASAAGA